ncbi:MAG: enoyl-CoA hydratase/isomerase family protein [Candidatus Omnitrophica bacterium]|nr:enoyl-CoA hydratase/isomerase family protein [Candidatus Omnitrophota bacterium]
MPDYQFLNLSIEEGIGFVKINRPPVNALGRGFLDELDRLIDEAAADKRIKVLIFASAIPNVFIAGVDLKEMAELSTPDEILKVVRRGQEVFNKLENCQKPVIAAIQGACVGGGQEFVMACHIRIASDRTRFAQPEITLGIIPGFGGSQRLPRIVGAARATELILTGDLLTPQEAFRMGLVNHVVSDGALLKTAREIAKKIARHGLPAIHAAMRAIGRGLDLPLAEGLKAEAEEFKSIAATRDMQEGIKAFLEKRQPKFTDS